jgi:hypothetical protein
MNLCTEKELQKEFDSINALTCELNNVDFDNFIDFSRYNVKERFKDVNFQPVNDAISIISVNYLASVLENKPTSFTREDKNRCEWIVTLWGLSQCRIFMSPSVLG